MERHRPSDFSPFLCPSQASEYFQAELFPKGSLQQCGEPIRIQVNDPNHLGRTRCLVAASASMRGLIARIRQVAATNAIVLLLGESGTGKNLLAWLIHQLSDRNKAPFVHFSAGQKSEQLIESELFGHEKGSFTGAHEARPGKLEVARGGTIFIDEIAELGISGQLKFHRFLDDGTYERLGGNKETIADVRVVAATHRDLGALAKEGKFREDLYYRINVVCLHVPPLRERPEDIPPIAQELLEDLARKHGKPYLRWSPESLATLPHLPWDGNVRALRNDIERMVIFAKGEVVQLEELPAHRSPSSSSHRQALRSGDLTCPERHRFHEAFIACRGNKSALSRMLNTSRSQVARLLSRYGVP